LVMVCAIGCVGVSRGDTAVPAAGPTERAGMVSAPAPADQTSAEADRKSRGCLGCHTQTDRVSMHDNPAVKLGCTDCHGGDASVVPERGLVRGEFEYARLRDLAHVLPRYPQAWGYPGSAKPQRSYTLLNRESPQFIRFMNPGDYRVADQACGACHGSIIAAAQRSLMATGAMFFGGASYNNGILPYKQYILGEAYTSAGEPASIDGPPLADPAAALTQHGVLPHLQPLPHWESAPTPDIFRTFEPGGRLSGNRFPEIALPNLSGGIQALNEPGRPDLHASTRGNGTGNRVSIPLLNMHKTRLNDPFMWFLGTNDQPGDYRSSGCSSCHVVYANDRDPLHSGPYAAAGNLGESNSVDPVIPRHESGHPLAHRFTRAIPTSQCMVCHMHQPNVFMNTFMGYTMWDYESDAPDMWPQQQRYPTAEQVRAVNDRNPEGAAPRGNWADPDFLAHVSELNPRLHDTQFADYHGHGWNFRAIYKRDRHGNLLDAAGATVKDDDPQKFKKAVHMASIHMEMGMQCVDCHFAQDNHSNGYLYGEVAQAIEIGCVDCHGTAEAYPTLRTSGPAAPPAGTDLSLLRNPDGSRRFEWREGKLYQHSLVTPGLEWRVHLVRDSVTPGSVDYNERSARAKLMSANPGTQAWGQNVPVAQRAHGNDKMECYACHTSWTTSCAGCHLPAETNWKSPVHRYEGADTRVFATYNPQVAREDMFMLGRRGTTDGGRIAPVRSSSALVVSSTNINREHVYIQQPPISASGYSSQAFNPHYPHTERTTETKTCDDCHLSAANDNNAIMAQLLLQGTNFVNFIGYYAWLGTAGGLSGVQVTEWEEPQAVIGSYLQKYAYPDNFRRHQALAQRLQSAHEHAGEPVRCLQLRGEYLYAAEGKRGLQVYDVASVANKAVSQPILTGPSSPLGHDTRIGSADATCVALPTDQPIHPVRNQGALMRDANQEQPFHPIYNYALVTDSREGLILTDINTLADGNPRNNQLRRALTWNPQGLLKGARHLSVGGHYAYIAADAGLVIVNLDDPLHPQVQSVVPLSDVRASALQFRYLFVTDREGLRTIDITDKQHPRIVPGVIPLRDAHRVYVARTYAYVAAGQEGLAIVDVEKPENMKLQQLMSVPDGLSDARDVVVGSTNASLFAYVADGRNGLTVLQLTSPESQPKFYGFSPEPRPRVIARYRTSKPALALSKGLDRDRAVDETGHQIAVFGRIGSRPLTLKESERLYLDTDGRPWFVRPR
ncbi:MAG: hypothetical protein JOZ93_07750, partial [Sinobacteraceae bacterium]|nr:hypothetical protein [Nevskiaceae bacterium]